MLKYTVTLAAVAGLVFALSGSASAALEGQLGILDATTLAGNNPATGSPWELGDQYHLAFITSSGRDATSATITVYDTFVQGVADGGSSIVATAGAVSWKAMASTPTVEAKAHLGVATGTGFATFNLHSVKLADDYPDLLDQSPTWTRPFDVVLTIDETGADLSDRRTYTGSTGTLTAYTDNEMGAADNTVGIGKLIGEGGIWACGDTTADTSINPMFAMSEPLEIVPEPATAALLLIGAPLLALRRRRR